MKKSILLSIILFGLLKISTGQTTALQFSGLDCYENAVDLFSDLDAGKAVILHFYMPDCGACPPPAEKIQAMANNIMLTYPGMVKGYAFPFQNSTTCDYSASWVEDNDLPFYIPMDSGATPVAYYGGFGMPTVVLLGGTDHRVMFSTLSFVTSDTTEMADSILALFGEETLVIESPELLKELKISPNPANTAFNLSVITEISGEATIVLMDISGKQVFRSTEYLIAGLNQKTIETTVLSDGLYIVQITTENSILSTQLIVNR